MEYQDGSISLAYPADSTESYWNYLVAALIKYSYLREADGSVTYGEDTTVQAQLDDWIAQEDGSYLVTASLLTYSDAEGSSNRTFQFILNDNGYKDELPDPLFYYTISNVSPMDDSFSDLTQETEENSPGQEPSTQNVSE